MNPRAERHVGVRRDQDHVALLVARPEHEHLRAHRPDLARREIDDGDDAPALELLAGIVRDLRAGALGPDLLAEVDRQLPGGLARLREVLDRDDPPHAHVDGEELVEVDRAHGPSVPKRKLRYGVLSSPRVPTSRALSAPPSGVASIRSLTPSLAPGVGCGSSTSRP